jgi:hypothetical protein
VAISLRAAGTATAAAAAVTAVNPAVPTGATTGDLSVLTVWMKPFGTTITTPSGWTKIGEATNGTTAAGTDTGSTKVAVFVKVSAAVGAIGNLSFAGSPNSCGAVINTYQNGTGAWDTSQFTTGGDTTNAANYSATGAAGIAVAAGDWVCQSTAVDGDVGTQSAQAIGGMSGATLGTYVTRQSADTTTGTDSHGEVGDVPVSSGSSSSAPTFTYTNASSGSGTTLWLRMREAAGATALVVQGAVHDQPSTTPALTQHQVLAAQNTAHAQPAGNVTLTQHQVLVIAGATHEQVAGALTVTYRPHYTLDIQGTVHDQVAGALTLTVHQSLDIQSSTHTHPAGNVTLTQHQVLQVAPAAHAQAAGNVTLTQHHVLTIAGTTHAQPADTPTLIQHQLLEVANTTHAQAAGNVTLTVPTTDGVALTIDSTTHAHTAGNLTLWIPTGTWWEWDGLLENPLTLDGEWDGATIHPLTANGITA